MPLLTELFQNGILVLQRCRAAGAGAYFKSIPASPLNIAQHFSAGLPVSDDEKSRQGRKVLADGHPYFCRPLRDSICFGFHHPAMNGWAIFIMPLLTELFQIGILVLQRCRAAGAGRDEGKPCFHVLPHSGPLPKERGSPFKFFGVRLMVRPIQRKVVRQRGERFSFSPGEKAGMRAVDKLT